MSQSCLPADLSAQTLLDALPEPCIAFSAAGEVVGWNTAFMRESRHSPRLAERCQTLFAQMGARPTLLKSNAGADFATERLELAEAELHLLRLRRPEPPQQQIETLRAFAAHAGHDLQEPVRKMLAFSSLLSRRYGDQLDQEGLQSLDFISDAAQRMRVLIQSCLAYIDAATRPMTPETVSLDALMADTLKARSDLIKTAEAQLTVASLPEVSADPALLKLVLEALVDNALKFRRGPGAQVVISAIQNGGFHRIEVRDDGIGVDPTLASKLFTPFGRLHPRETYPGAALGLAASRVILERHGGKIWLEPGKGEGACFIFTLPA